MTKVSFLLFMLSAVLFSSKRLLRYLRYLQQETYRPGRFFRWFVEHRAFDRRGLIAVVLAGITVLLIPRLSFFIGAALLLGWYFKEEDPRKSGKLKLVMTPRATRIYVVAMGMYLVLQAVVSLMNIKAFWFAQIVLFQLLPVILIGSVQLLSFDENRRQKLLVKEAREKFRKIAPFTIGITGSYGKTSTKSALATILNVTLGATFWPKKGINTEMGITREIREGLKKGTPYAVVEMGAYTEGSIARLCQLTPPHAGIITTIGVAHLDRFGDQETIRKAKSELAQAIPFEGILVCNGDNEGARRIAAENVKNTTVLYGFDQSRGDLACWIETFEVTPAGTIFSFVWKGKKYSGKTPLVGKAALSNLAAAFTMASALGADPDFVIGVLANLSAVDNRLQIHQEEKITFIRDAYNSNPEGFSDALDVLAKFDSKRKVLMTPGMIELADLGEDLHEKIGRKAGKICDYAIVIGEVNRSSLTKGMLSGGMTSEQIIYSESREKAFEELDRISISETAVLIENDLPDLYQDKIRF